MAKFQFTPIVGDFKVITARLGAGSGTSNHLTDAEVGKLVKLVGDSQYNLAAAGDLIEGFITSVETATLDNYTVGGVAVDCIFKEVTFDGLQATPGTGVLAVGDYVCVGSVSAKGTALVFPAHAKVCKATTQSTVSGSPFAWRVESLGSAGTGAVGTVGVIRRI
jgi:hypothetical protein